MKKACVLFWALLVSCASGAGELRLCYPAEMAGVGVAISTADAQQAGNLQQVRVSYGGIAPGWGQVDAELWASPIEAGHIYVKVRTERVNVDPITDKFRSLIQGRSPQLPYSAVGWHVWIKIVHPATGEVLAISSGYAVYLK